MENSYPYGLQPTLTNGAKIVPLDENAWRLFVPPVARGYRLAQLDDYRGVPRHAFPHRPPLHLHLRARASAITIPGTWGFGLWNDPFSMGLLADRRALRLPTWPQAAWFFFAAPPNWLSLHDDLPAQGFLAATFRSPAWPASLLLPAAPLLALLAIPFLARLARRGARRLVRQDAAVLAVDPTEWHTYALEWQQHGVSFFVDDHLVLRTNHTPLAPLGLVIWVDNQYLAFTPRGHLHYGMHPCPQPAWVDIADVTLTPLE